MNVSLDWLNDYITIDIPVKELAERLTMFGLEVESTRELGQRYDKYVVGEVLTVRRHPSADKLWLCEVNVGSQALQIVCGAPNVAAGRRVAVATVGAVVAHDQHDPEGRAFVIRKAQIRGQLSEGMICSAFELDLGEDREGILVLTGRSSIGMPLAVYLGLDDTVLELGITPNRPDALSHFGIAREVGAILSKHARLPRVGIKEDPRKATAFASIRILDVEDCPRYTARIVLDIKVGDSPAWIKDRLSAIGVRPVNNVVDITNYVLMEIGHPLHAFDYDRISGHSIVVRKASPGEPFVTLDNKARKLRGSELMICDGERPIAIAGVMGGANSEINNETRNVLIEGAYFAPRSIRRTSKSLGISTEASQRFERGADPNITEWALDRAVSLVQQSCGGRVLKGRIDQYPKKILSRRIKLRLKRTNELLGTSLTAKEASSFLKRLSIPVVASGKGARSLGELMFTTPTWRPDLEREIDLVEEIARVYGYSKIGTSARSLLSYPNVPPERDYPATIREWLVGSGYHEIVTNSMQDKSLASLSFENFVEIANPINKDMAALRTSLIPSALGVIRHNIFHGTKDFRVFEFGKVYFRTASSEGNGSRSGFQEEERLLLACTGAIGPPNWDGIQPQSDILFVKGELETLFQKIFLDKLKFIPYPTTKALTEVGLGIEINGRTAGVMGLVGRELLKGFEIDQDVCVAEISLEPLVRSLGQPRRYRELPKYPSVMRDLALIVDAGVPVEKIAEEIRSAGRPLLSKMELFDVYTGEQIGGGKKSCAFALEFMAEDHTLTQQEVDRVMKEIIDRVSLRLQATLRS
jgi:phenylalanyl-tRNA synthetase beta chain